MMPIIQNKLPLLLLLTGVPSPVTSQNAAYQSHYLVGLLNYPNSKANAHFGNVTSGTYIPNDRDEDWIAHTTAPYNYQPGVGFSDMEPYYDEEGEKVRGEFYCLADNGFGGVYEENSADYALHIDHMLIQKPFTYRHGESTFDKYTEAISLNKSLIHDPNNFIKWENGADLQVTYKIPDSTWNEWKDLRALTGRDIDPEGLAVINQECAVLGDEHMPAAIMVNPKTGVVLSPFVRTPDIDEDGNILKDKFLSTRRDKVHCAIEDLEADTCDEVESSMVGEAGYRLVDKSGGYEGFSLLDDGTVAAFIEKKNGDTTLQDEPGVRVYKLLPGDCTSGSAPVFDSFRGFYKFEVGGADKIADVSAIPGTSRYVVVIERNTFPIGHMFPAQLMPVNNLCIVDLEDLDENMVMQNKKCILNYHNIDDPWDVDGNGIFKYALSQVTNEALVVVDDFCIVAGTDTNYPWLDPMHLNKTEVPDYQEVTDARFMIVCFVEPVFNVEYLEMFMTESGGTTGTTVSNKSRVSSSSWRMSINVPLFLTMAMQVFLFAV